MPNLPTPLPQWTAEDFYGDEPYRWLYEHREDRFLFQRYLAQAQVMSKALHVIGFSKMWNAYVDSQNPRKNATYISATEFPGQPEQLQAGMYLCNDLGVTYISPFGESVQVISHPIMPVRRIINVDSNEEKLEIAYSRGGSGKWRSVIVGRELLASAQKIIALARHGIAVNSENAKEVVKYLSTLESLNYDSFRVQNSTSHMGWLPDGQFAPFARDIVYDGESAEFQKIYAGLTEGGSEDVWMDTVKAVRAGNSVPARIALAASFAAPLVSVMGALPFFVHLWGTQGCGKTVGLLLAASVWGRPEMAGYIKTFSGTKVSLELYAAFCCNIPILLDELQVISDRKSFDDIIYSLCEGASKGRGAKEGGLQLQRKWSSCIITTGEMPIVQGNSGGGAAVRTIEVNYGGQPLFEDARTTANLLKENYGFAGKKFIEALNSEGVIQALKAKQKRYYSELSGEIQDKQTLSASILLAADFLADKAIFHDGKALTVEDIKPYLITRDQADVNNRCYQWLMGYLAANQRHFNGEPNADQWGAVEKNVVYIVRSEFDRILHSEGYSPGSFLTWADRNRKILTDKTGNQKRNTKRKRIGNMQVACVALVLPDDDEDNPVQPDRDSVGWSVRKDTAPKPVEPIKPPNENYVEVTDDDLPF